MRHDRRHLGLRGLAPMPVIMDGDRDEVGPSRAPALSSQQPFCSLTNDAHTCWLASDLPLAFALV